MLTTTRFMIAAASLLLASAAFAAKPAVRENWWTYKAGYDQGPGITEVNIALMDKAPLDDYPVLLITGVHYAKSREADGLPPPKDVERLQQLAKDTVALVKKNGEAIYAGSFTYNREQALFFYIQDPTKIKPALEAFYKEKCANCQSYVTVRMDRVWQTYRVNLYPNAATRKWYAKEWEAVSAKK
ncbi:DUF695 domain-containing protein [Massilia sp. TS11]|uniref:DUF695 domain-containing protein n=1 Tax=Massilia sp. TS11 TaxID=2908003 RepID=UPI001EDB8BE2|nr:DUF695 domain-containing protein [Massilia sp. TS11]MCG2586162.1 DUF695 domain-containing protein [Massilia sp. TS11]